MSASALQWKSEYRPVVLLSLHGHLQTRTTLNGRAAKATAAPTFRRAGNSMGMAAAAAAAGGTVGASA